MEVDEEAEEAFEDEVEGEEVEVEVEEAVEDDVFEDEDTARYRQRFLDRFGAKADDSRVLCLHYYSNALGFDFGDQEDVYRIDQIEEWAKTEDPIWMDRLKEFLFKIAGRKLKYLLFNLNPKVSEES